jgi:hypothetical protein
VPNLLTLRTGPVPVLVCFDAAFFDEQLGTLLRHRGFPFSCAARTTADFRVEVSDAELDRFLAGRVLVPRGRLVAAARVWRALVVVENGVRRTPTRSRDVGLAGTPVAAANGVRDSDTDSVRGPGGRRVKARPRRRSAVALPSAPAAAQDLAPTVANDPAAFALSQLLRLAGRVVELVRAEGGDAVVSLVDGTVDVDGTVRGSVGPP